MLAFLYHLPTLAIMESLIMPIMFGLQVCVSPDHILEASTRQVSRSVSVSLSVCVCVNKEKMV